MNAGAASRAFQWSGMAHWFSGLSWLQLCWVTYAGLMALLAPLVAYIESQARKVDGASGWVLFNWLLLGAFGLLVLLGLSALNWFLRRNG
jgi:hypothetical protein